MKTTLSVLLYFLVLNLNAQSSDAYQSFSSDSETLMLTYDAFGPQVLAYDFLGPKWWQWESSGNSNPNTTYDIRVIVYKGISLAEAKAKYPVDKSNKHDFRYASYEESIAYLDGVMREQFNDFPIKQYFETKKKIIFHFHPQ